MVQATKSAGGQLLAASECLFDPRWLTVALSRAKAKLVLVASRSMFELFSADDETHANALLWQNLLCRRCVVPLREGKREGVGVQVLGTLPRKR